MEHGACLSMEEARSFVWDAGKVDAFLGSINHNFPARYTVQGEALLLANENRPFNYSKYKGPFTITVYNQSRSWCG